MVAIMGPSGSGKSTLLNMIGLLDRPTSGSYILDGKEVSKLSGGEQSKVRGRRSASSSRALTCCLISPPSIMSNWDKSMPVK